MRYFALVMVLGLVFFTGCQKKEAPSQDTAPVQDELSETVTVIEEVPQQSTEQAQQEVQAIPEQPAALKQEGVFEKPSTRDVQTALQNAGFYKGTIDGISGPMTKQAIKDFQSANGLTADGKVGPKTWAALAPYLTKTAGSSSAKTR